MQNGKLTCVFDAWSATVSSRKRQKAIVGRVLMRLQSGLLFLSFERWVEAAAALREERTAAATKIEMQKRQELKLLSERAVMSKFDRIKRAFFLRLSKMCYLTSRNSFFSFKLRVLRKWRLRVRLYRRLSVWESFQSVRFFLFWCEAMPQLRLQNAVHEAGAKAISRKVVQSKVWR
jgi:hypothetical protein